MPKFSCYVCGLSRKPKFFPKSQPYAEYKICEKCITKNEKRNQHMINMLIKRTNITPTFEENQAIALSFRTEIEMKRIMQEDAKSAEVLNQLGA